MDLGLYGDICHIVRGLFVGVGWWGICPSSWQNFLSVGVRGPSQGSYVFDEVQRCGVAVICVRM